MNQQDIEQVVKAVLLKMKDSSQPASTVMRWAFCLPG